MHEKMRDMPILELIIKMSLPAMFSMLISALYNIVDSIFVARIGQREFSAVSLFLPVQVLLIALAVGTGVGLNSLISRRLGEGNHAEANEAANHGITLALILSFLFALMGIFFTKSFISLFTADEVIFKNACNYSYIITIFSFGLFVQIIIEKMIQSTGNMLYPMISSLVGALINVILDPIMIFGYFGMPALGVRGAAIATVTGQIIAMCLSTYFLICRQKVLKIKLFNFKLKKDVVKQIYVVGLPSIIMQAISSVLFALMNRLLINFSELAVNVLGIYLKLNSFVFMPVFGITQGAMPVMGYNFGAKDRKRLISALKISAALAVGVMMLGSFIFFVFTKELLLFFKATDELLLIGIPALRIFSIGFVFAAGGIMLSTLFQACGFGFLSLLSSILRQIIIIIPLSYLFADIWGLQAVWYAFPISDFISFAISVLFYQMYIKNKISGFETLAVSSNYN